MRARIYPDSTLPTMPVSRQDITTLAVRVRIYPDRIAVIANSALAECGNLVLKASGTVGQMPDGLDSTIQRVDHMECINSVNALKKYYYRKR